MTLQALLLTNDTWNKAHLFAFLSKRDLLHLSRCSSAFGSLKVDVHIVKQCFRSVPASLLSSEAVTLAYLRENVAVHNEDKHICGTKSTSFDEQFTSPEDSDSGEEVYLIEKHLESASFDEFDDFNPRHPMPKDKVHRRGDSYFNSDISDVAARALAAEAALGLSHIAKLALDAEGMEGC